MAKKKKLYFEVEEVEWGNVILALLVYPFVAIIGIIASLIPLYNLSYLNEVTDVVHPLDYCKRTKQIEIKEKKENE